MNYDEEKSDRSDEHVENTSILIGLVSVEKRGIFDPLSTLLIFLTQKTPCNLSTKVLNIILGKPIFWEVLFAFC